MAERLQAAVGIDRDLAAELEGALQHLLPRGAPLGEAEVLVDEQLGRREAVVHLGHGDLAARVGDARLRIRVLRGCVDLGEPRVVVRGIGVARAVAGDERQRLDVERLVGEAVRVLGPHDDRRRRAVGDTRAVVEAEPAGHERRVADRLQRDLAPELRARVAGAVVVVLPRDAGEHVAHLLVAHAVALAVRGRAHREHRRRGERAAGAVAGRLGRADEPLVAAVLDLLDADRHRDVVGAARHRVRGVAQRLGARRAVVLDPASPACRAAAAAGPAPCRSSPTSRCRTSRRRRPASSTPAEASASVAASISRSSAPLSQCSPNGVQPMPTMATRSLMPCEAMPSVLSAPDGARLPEVVVDAVGGEQAPERHLDRAGPSRAPRRRRR